ncbi:MAG: diaminopimelate epimerase [Chloroflexi bacterium]|nr:diaminopimelate epimerase [Chloroflexota bacterium]
MKFTKLHGAGNDFIVVDARGQSRDWSKLAIAICDRHTGVGADGLLTVNTSEVAALRMGLYNSDGSEAELSGNGMRCFVKYAVDRSLVDVDNGVVTVETLAGVIPTEVRLEGGKVTSARVNMGRPRFAPQEIPIALEAKPPLTGVALELKDRSLLVTCLSMGNPHAVHLSDEPITAFPLEVIGPQVEHHALFPQRTNFSIAHVRSRTQIEARTWERGVGPTLACGSGSSAVIVAAHLAGLVDDEVAVHVPGGVLELAWDGEGDVSLSGPAVEVFEGEWPA